MNSLSWLIYFADVLPVLAGSLRTMSAVTLFASLCTAIILYDVSTDSYRPKKEVQHYQRISRRATKTACISLVIFFCAVLMPSKNTIYAIAVYETGEKVLQSEWGKRGDRAIEAWITKQIEESSSKSSK